MKGLLQDIDSPEDLKELSFEELETLCQEIRDYFIHVVTSVGGHFASSLGVVELTTALHYVYDTPKDKLIWDVGHQGYVHKILTGRKYDLKTIRQYKGISGFLKRSESEYDDFGAGHASTSISAALGFAVARDLNKDDHRVVAVIGDGALTGGLAYEALNNAGSLNTDLLVILNDNQMSISRNVGAISRYLTEITTDPRYNKIKDEIWHLTEKMPFGKRRLRKFVRRVEESLKNLLVPGMFFEEIGFRYFGPIDGHDLRELVPTLQKLRELKGPNVLHILTVKGKGVDYAEEDSVKFHAVSPPPKQSEGDKKAAPKPPTYNGVFTDALIELSKKDERIVAITAAMAEGTGLVKYQKAFPDRFFDVGIAEGHAVTYSAGLAADGVRPCAAIYSTFLQRAYDHIIHDVAVQKLPVVFALDRAGLCGADGPTHHGAFDLSYLAIVPGMIVSAPKDGNELRNLLHTAFLQDTNPFAIRFPKDSCITLDESCNFQKIAIGSWEVLREGNNLAILAVGTMVANAMKAAEMLENKHHSVAVINCRFIKPLDASLLRDLSTQYEHLVTVEENVLSGGFGSQVSRHLQENGWSVGSLTHLGIPDSFIEHGSRAILLDNIGLSPEKIADKCLEIMGGGKKPRPERQSSLKTHKAVEE
ncbi:MAG: 1-deoxy-D-xylulose-5-phosphate synthase [Calditrichaeota bacterium]|nr:1-deoxy-D-xylulose-5-phosphate synthase [Calditrichota bacterium]